MSELSVNYIKLLLKYRVLLLILYVREAYNDQRYSEIYSNVQDDPKTV